MTRASLARGAALLATCGLIACSHAGGESSLPPPNAPPVVESTPTPPTAAPARYDEAQRAQGEKYYRRDCGACHGDAGQGTAQGPRIVGRDALPFEPPALALQRKTHFVTARDVYKFLYGHMPNDAIGTTTESYYWDVLAFVLVASGIDLGGHVLDEAGAGAIVLHPEP